jgi:hypothetical protein
MRFVTDGRHAVEPRPMALGDQVVFDRDHRPWTVKAVTENFVALTRPIAADEVDDEDEGDGYDEDQVGQLLYTVIDWRNGVRGACDLSGGGYGNGVYDEAECAQMLAEFESGELEVSVRRVTRLRFADQ